MHNLAVVWQQQASSLVLADLFSCLFWIFRFFPLTKKNRLVFGLALAMALVPVLASDLALALALAQPE